MKSEWVRPQYGANEFNCPHCGAYSTQFWIDTDSLRFHHSTEVRNRLGIRISFVGNIAFCACLRCRNITVWVAEQVTDDRPAEMYDWNQVYPITSSAPPPSEDIPKEIFKEYSEARSIVGDSPRAAAAMLRLCLQKLMPILGENDGHLRTDIQSLVDKGLPQDILQALDSLRIFGNESLHPGTIDLNEDPATALVLFKALNIIIDRMITDKKELRDLHNLTPPSKRIIASKHDAN